MSKKMLGGKIEIIGGDENSRDKFASKLEDYIVDKLQEEDELKLMEKNKKELKDEIHNIGKHLKTFSEAYTKEIQNLIKFIEDTHDFESHSVLIKEFNKRTRAVNNLYKAFGIKNK